MKIIFRNIFVVAFTVFVCVSCTSLMSDARDKLDSVKISSIKSVAVVSFTVPRVASSGFLNDLGKLIGLAGAVVSGDDSNSSGRQIANELSAGFIEGMSASGHWNILSLKKVSTNAGIKSLQQDAEKKYGQVSMDGTPAVKLRLDGKSSEYAEQAAKALGVDGVMMLAADNISYVLDEGERSINTGVAKIKFNGVFKLYNKAGNSMWEAEITARSDETAYIVAGVVNPSNTTRLNKSLGRALASDVLKRYKNISINE